MRRASVTIGTLLVLGAATALVSCGGDDSTGPTGTGGAGGAGATGGSGGSTGGSAGSGGSKGGAGGASGAGTADSGPDQSSGGASGAGGSAGKAGGSGAAGAGGKGGSAGAGGSSGAGGTAAGASGAGGSAGSAGQDSGTGGSAGGTMDATADASHCPAAQPVPGSSCAIEVDCIYGSATCTCADPGPNGTWLCHGGHDDAGGADGGNCPASDPTGEFCPDAGLPIGPCIYGGNTRCTCNVGDVEWFCVRSTPAR
jgi:hypothetical protein